MRFHGSEPRDDPTRGTTAACGDAARDLRRRSATRPGRARGAAFMPASMRLATGRSRSVTDPPSGAWLGVPHGPRRTGRRRGRAPGCGAKTRQHHTRQHHTRQHRAIGDNTSRRPHRGGAASRGPMAGAASALELGALPPQATLPPGFSPGGRRSPRGPGASNARTHPGDPAPAAPRRRRETRGPRTPSLHTRGRRGAQRQRAAPSPRSQSEYLFSADCNRTGHPLGSTTRSLTRPPRPKYASGSFKGERAKNRPPGFVRGPSASTMTSGSGD